MDRLFDGHSSAIDVSALLFATAAALEGTEHFEPLETAAANVLEVVRLGLSADEEQVVVGWVQPTFKIIAEMGASSFRHWTAKSPRRMNA